MPGDDDMCGIGGWGFIIGGSLCPRVLEARGFDTVEGIARRPRGREHLLVLSYEFRNLGRRSLLRTSMRRPKCL